MVLRENNSVKPIQKQINHQKRICGNPAMCMTTEKVIRLQFTTSCNLYHQAIVRRLNSQAPGIGDNPIVRKELTKLDYIRMKNL